MAQTGSIEITVKNLRSHQGYLALNLFSKEKSQGFPSASENAVRKALMKIPEKTEAVELSFEDLPYGVYAVSVLHDEDGDQKLKTFLGIPREGFGFSNNPLILLGPPSFQKASFELKAEKMRTEIKMVYLL